MSTYKGHAGQGGLQNHSVGGLYPYAVYGRETPDGTRYGVMNCATGWEGTAEFTCAEAYACAEFNKSGTRSELFDSIAARAFRVIARTAR